MKPSEAEEHLRVIRSLMERATIYRAISAPTALVGGLLSVAVGAVLHFRGSDSAQAGLQDAESVIFLAAWGAVLTITGMANVWFLAREAQRRGGAFLSPGMRKALFALFPAMLAAGVITVAFATLPWIGVLPIVWMIFYGLALLSAAQFSPQAIPRLGWGFLIAGLICVGLVVARWRVSDVPRLLDYPNLLMALTFGGLHLLYAVCTWSARESEEDPHV
jgi:hypothetical protein